MPTESALLAQLSRLGTELEKRAKNSTKINGYYEGGCPFPAAVVRARLTNAYRLLMPMAEVPWGSTVVDSVIDRLEVAGVRDDDKAVADAVWGIWQDNAMDAESKLAHKEALIDGRCFATIWPELGGPPQITLDSSSQMIVAYAEGSRRRRAAALRYWVDEAARIPYATLYRPEAIYKYVGPKYSTGFEGTRWSPRQVAGEEWPLANTYDLVPVVELAVNRRIKPGIFGHARGEYEHVTGLIDRINLLTFLGLIVALWLGFPLRGVIGDAILRDDDGKPIAPFDADADAVFQLENPEAKLAEFKAADRGNLSIFAELAQLAYITKTPAHYFPLESGISNISADTIRALEGGLHAKVDGHKSTLGEGELEILRLGGLMLETPVTLSARAELDWRDSESRSLAERADAATKLKDILPWQALAEHVLNAKQDEISRWEAMRSSDAFSKLLGEAANPAPAPAPAAA